MTSDATMNPDDAFAGTSNPYAYPTRFDVERPPSQSRLTNFPLGIGFLIRSILLIPQFIVVYLVSIVAAILYFVATFAILFTGKYPEGMYNFVANYVRWNANVSGYLLSLYDKYPPFSGSQQADYPLKFSVPYPATSSRLLNFPLFIGLMIRAVLLIPHFIIIYFLALAEFVVVFIAQFAILFTGSFPAGMHGFAVGVSRWSTRLSAYMFGLSDRYPPFST
jgi:hypothetical protein